MVLKLRYLNEKGEYVYLTPRVTDYGFIVLDEWGLQEDGRPTHYIDDYFSEEKKLPSGLEQWTGDLDKTGKEEYVKIT
jgi:hypothetical protein